MVRQETIPAPATQIPLPNANHPGKPAMQPPTDITVRVSCSNRDFGGGNERGHDYTAPSDERPRLFVGSGSEDEPVFRQPAMRWIEHWTATKEIPWDLKAVILETHTRFSAPPASFRQGMKWLFPDPVDPELP